MTPPGPTTLQKENHPATPPPTHDLLLLSFSSYLFSLFALFSKGVTLHLLQEADGNVVDLLLVEHGQSVRLPGALVRAVSDEEGTILQQNEWT